MPAKRTRLLSSSRPPAKVSSAASPSTANLSSKHTRSVIRSHHTLQKQRAQATAASDADKVRELEAMLAENGGLKLYQKASMIGQGSARGGDTSKVLVEWLREDGVVPRARHGRVGESNALGGVRKSGGLRILEVGALSTQNALNIPGATKVRRIDLHSQHPEIDEVDFMQLDPEEEWQGERGYEILSLSLVVNFVGDPRDRGDMLRHTVGSFRPNNTMEDGQVKQGDEGQGILPALFLVLPLPCVDNSRYLTEEHLTAVLEALGYEKTRVKRSGKLYYSLWRLSYSTGADGNNLERSVGEEKRTVVFKKEQVRKGTDRNNFCIVLSDAS